MLHTDGEVAGAVADVAGMDRLSLKDVRQHARHIQEAPMILLDANLPADCLQVIISSSIITLVKQLLPSSSQAISLTQSRAGALGLVRHAGLAAADWQCVVACSST